MSDRKNKFCENNLMTSQGSVSSHPYQFSNPCSLRILHEDETVNRVPPAPLAAFGSHKLTATQIRRARMSKQMSEDCTRQTQQRVLHYPLSYSGKDTNCENSRNFLPLRFYVKSNMANLELQKLKFWQCFGLWVWNLALGKFHTLKMAKLHQNKKKSDLLR